MCKTNLKSSIKRHVKTEQAVSTTKQIIKSYSVLCWHMGSLNLVKSVSYRLLVFFFHSVVQIEGVSGQGMWNANVQIIPEEEVA